MSSSRGLKVWIDDREVVVDIYPVGVLSALSRAIRVLRIDVFKGHRVRLVQDVLRSEWRFILGYCIKGRRWRSLKNSFNGYLAEHQHPCSHNAGTGWSKKRALRRSNYICRSRTKRSVLVKRWEDE